MIRRALLSFLLLSPILTFAQINLDLSHFGRVNDLVFDEPRGLLFSAGEDGTVRIWDAEQHRLLQTVRVGHEAIRQIAVHPEDSHIAVLTGDELDSDTLEVWDWQRRRRLFAVQSDTQLLHFAYSPKGSYLFYSEANFKSLTALNPRTGRVLPYMGRGFGIVSYFTVAGNEGNIMTYQPSGSITYWDIRSGRSVRQIRAPEDLERIRISPNNRYVIAVRQNELVIVDILSGDTIDSTRVSGIVDLSFAPTGNEIAGIVAGEKGRELKKWYFGGRYLIELSTPAARRYPGVNCAVHRTRELYLANDAGDIFLLAVGGEDTHVGADNRKQISGMAITGSALAVATESDIFFYDSEFFLSPYEAQQDLEIRESSYPNPFSCPVGLAFLDEQRLLVWCRGGESGRLAVLNTWYGGTQDLPVEADSAIRQVTVQSQGIVVVEESGLCRILDPDSFDTTFQYNAPGMNKLMLAYGDTLVGAKTSLSALSGPLLQINSTTGETVPIRDSSLFVYDLFYSGTTRGGRLYSLAVQEGARGVQTVVKLHTGFGFERNQILKVYDGEDLGAAIVGDDSGNVFTSLGYEGLTLFREARSTTLESSGQIPRSLYIHNRKLYSLNRDSSISIWDIATRQLLANVHLLRDGTWRASRG